MRKSKVLTYSVVLSLICMSLITSAMFPALAIIERISSNPVLDFSVLDVYYNVMAANSNYFYEYRIVILYILAFAFGLNYVFFTDKPCFLVRLQSRTDYIKKHIVDILIFTAIFAFLFEAVNIIFSFAVFGAEMTINSGLLQYSAIDFVTEFLFYMRVGIILFIAGILINKKYAPFVTFGIYFAELFLKDYITALENVWLPYRDSVVVTKLLIFEILPVDVIPIIIRGIAMNMVLLILAYYLFKKKDIIKNEIK